MIVYVAFRFCGSSAARDLEGAFIGQICQRRGVSLKDDWRGDAWEAVGEADVPCIGIHGHLKDFREGDVDGF